MADINQVSVKGTVYDIADETVRSELADSLAIVANGNTHVAIAQGQFVYVRNHSSLANGLYTAKSAISANATLSTSNLEADSQGGLNALNSKIHKVAEVSASIPSDSGTTVAYPNGFTMNNTFILATFTIDGSGNKYFVPGETSGNIKQNGIGLNNKLDITATVCALIMKYE